MWLSFLKTLRETVKQNALAPDKRENGAAIGSPCQSKFIGVFPLFRADDICPGQLHCRDAGGRGSFLFWTLARSIASTGLNSRLIGRMLYKGFHLLSTVRENFPDLVFPGRIDAFSFHRHQCFQAYGIGLEPISEDYPCIIGVPLMHELTELQQAVPLLQDFIQAIWLDLKK